MSFTATGKVRQGVRDDDLRALKDETITEQSVRDQLHVAGLAASSLIASLKGDEFNVTLAGGNDGFAITIVALKKEGAEAETAAAAEETATA